MVATQRPDTQDQADELSALIDGELSDEHAARALDRLLADPAAQTRWLTYHVQADALRFPSPSALRDDTFLASFGERFEEEPVHLPARHTTRSGRSARLWRRHWLRYGMPGAAAAAAVAVVSWMTVPSWNGRGSEVGIVAATGTAQRANAPVLQQDYLLAHQQFAPSSRFHGVATYVRTANLVTPAQAGNDPRTRR